MHLNLFNQALGGAIMGLIGLLIFSVLVWFSDKAGMIGEQTKMESRTLPHLLEMPVRSKVVADRIKPFVLEAWETSVKWIDRVEDYGEQKTGVSGGPDEPRIYRIPDGKTPGIEGAPTESRGSGRSIYEDTGTGIED